jgi:hypothetical protein
VINTRENGFAKMLQSDAVIWFQKYQSSDVKRGSISLDRQIGTHLRLFANFDRHSTHRDWESHTPAEMRTDLRHLEIFNRDAQIQ